MGLSGKLIGWLSLVGVVSAIGFAQRFAGGKPPRNALFHYSTAAAELVTFAVILAVVLWIAKGPRLRELLALRRPRSWWRALWIAVSVLLLVYALNAALDPLLHPGREQGLTPHGWQPAHAGAFAANVFAFAIVGPIVEELTFRGVGYGLLARYGDTFAILAVGLAFGLWHGLVEALPILIAFGTGLAYMRSRTGSVYPGILLHASFNAIALAVAVV